MPMHERHQAVFCSDLMATACMLVMLKLCAVGCSSLLIGFLLCGDERQISQREVTYMLVDQQALLAARLG